MRGRKATDGLRVTFCVPGRNDPEHKFITARVVYAYGCVRFFTFSRDIDLRYTRRYVIPSLLNRKEKGTREK
ncbi:hypothetical protein [Paenibacillus alvei]|uniref:Uncharacterized protein n=1 Tax=Paenibacillus alvei TaxID=44250 RepID=A0AAP7A134_PAEAL|nr:hypothetical protein [Paenibacillus alvei]NOJ71416.1 hypothetical protein [Paenibacillus alvei]